MVEHHPGRTVLEAEPACRGLVVPSDVYSPGWRATVDGGRPRSVYAGAAKTEAGAILVLAAALAGLRKRQE